MRYGIGEKVCVRADLQANKRYDGTSTTPRMEKLKGQTVIISKAHRTVSGRLVYNVKETGGLWWTDEMFTRKSYTPDELFDALLRGAIDEEAYNKMLEEA